MIISVILIFCVFTDILYSTYLIQSSIDRIHNVIYVTCRSAEEDMDQQRHLMMSGYDDELHKRQHEYRLKVDEMSSKLLEKDLKVGNVLCSKYFHLKNNTGKIIIVMQKF